MTGAASKRPTSTATPRPKSGARKASTAPKRTKTTTGKGARVSGAKKRASTQVPKQTEAGFLATLRAMAKMLQWRTYHTHDSRRSEAGFPDLVLVRRPRVIFAELKKDGKNPTAIQQAWLDELKACGQETYCWRPADLEEIARVLR